jgi:diguanylate cyclase (GGDEF)-like protein
LEIMGSAGYIIAINMFVAGLLAAAFMTVAAQDRRRAAPRWIALSYLCGMAYAAVESIVPLFDNTLPFVLASFAILLLATMIFNIGIASKYAVAVPSRAMTAFFIVATVGVYLVQDLPRQSLLRMLAYQLPYAAMQLTAVALIASSRQRRDRLDHALTTMLGLSALQFVAKPFIAQWLGGWGVNAQAYSNTSYALASQSMGAISAIAIALLLLAVTGRDILADMRARSETDMLSGLLNRGGFESYADLALGDARTQGMTVSLVIADLDHFKSINDKFGHAGGDKVIVSFADFIRSAMNNRHVAGRIGGEEFAILLPGTNVVAARLFAEGARNAFSGLEIDGLPNDKRVTASFGVAELAEQETIADLMERADKALYLAKASGRDCVKIAARPDKRRDVDQTGAAISLK